VLKVDTRERSPHIVASGKRNAEMTIAMQVRCVHCKREQWMPAVYEISHGKSPCRWCGKMSKEMTEEEYRKEMDKT
jgi:hypothetical protein